MLAAGIHSQLTGNINKLIPCPGLGRIGGRWRDSSLLQHIGVVVQVMDNPTGTDAVPLAVDGCAALLGWLDEVIRLADHGVVLHTIGDIHHHTARHVIGHVAGPKDIGRRAASQHGLQLGLVFLIRGMQPVDFDVGVLALEQIQAFLDILLFQEAAPTHHRDRHLGCAALRGGGGGSSRLRGTGRALRRRHRRRRGSATSGQQAGARRAKAETANVPQERTARKTRSCRRVGGVFGRHRYTLL
jgi:hypothetical protein